GYAITTVPSRYVECRLMPQSVEDTLLGRFGFDALPQMFGTWDLCFAGREGKSRSLRPEELTLLLHGMEGTSRRRWYRV
ncbi:MAG: hypothetical protein WCQ21_25895, partial [Verrucomicrobiota bacterium]